MTPTDTTPAEALINAAATVSTMPEFSHIESPLILAICEAYERTRPTPDLLPCHDKQEAFEQFYTKNFGVRFTRRGASYSDTQASLVYEGWKARGEYERTHRQPTHEAVEKIREALEAAPVYVTKDGTWLNLRPNANKRTGGAMFKIEGPEAEAIRAFGKKVAEALALLPTLAPAQRPAMTEDEREKVVIEMCDAYDWKSPDEDDPADFNAMSAALAVIERRKGA